jgi:ketosteroid isomerase-like protein
MDERTMYRVAEHTLEAWSRQDVEEVIACYTSDLVYLDPNTQGPIRGSDPMRALPHQACTAGRMGHVVDRAHG